MTETDQATLDLRAMYEVLMEDALRAWKTAREDDDQYNRRSYVRAVFAAVEGTVYLLKRETLRRNVTKFTAAEISLLREESYALDAKGLPYSQPKFLPLDQNFRFTIETFMRLGIPEYRLEVSECGWEAFKRAIQVRHRVTHPKNLELLSITDADMEVVASAFRWFTKVVILGLCDYVEVVENETKRLQQEVADLKRRVAVVPAPVTPTPDRPV